MIFEMESSSSPIHRSNNTTPHHHYHTNSMEQQKSFTNSLVSNRSQISYHNTSRDHFRRTTDPRVYTPTNYSGGRRTQSRTHTPSIHSSGDGESHIMSMENTLPSNFHQLNGNLMMNSSGSHSITPPNSNSNTTISCGSGNSTSANIGMPTSTPKSTLNHNNNHIKRETDLENLKNTSTPKGKKSILEEEDNDIEKCVVNKSARTRTSWAGLPSQEFLPICDALFNVISLAAYFCDIVFDVLTAYTWYKMSQEEVDEFLQFESPEAQEKHQILRAMWWQWSLVAMTFITLSSVLCQSLSFKWYKESRKRGQIGPDGMELEGPPTPCNTGVLILMHLSLGGVLWRYFKLFIPIDLRFVKNEVRDLCLLRLVHAFCEAVPMLLIQLYLIWGTSGPDAISNFTIVSTSLSLFSVCWALASFSKHVRKQNVHKLVLTWLGVIFQFLWHFGTVISRVVALSLYASVYQFWIFLVLVLHWFTMLLWLISPKNLYHGEKISTFRKVIYSTLLAVVYTFCYINVQESNSRQKVITYYVIMFLENSLLFSVWLIAKRYEDEIWYKTHCVSAVFLGFFGGIIAMILYYRYFHLKRLSYVYDTESSIYRSSSMLNGTIYSPNKEKNTKELEDNGLPMIISNRVVHNNNNNSKQKKTPQDRFNKRDGSKVEQKNGLKSDKASVGGQRGVLFNKINGHHIHHSANVPGVFNCRFHPAMKRKKKIPSTFVPPPTNNSSPTTSLEETTRNQGSSSHNQSSTTQDDNFDSISNSIAQAHNQSFERNLSPAEFAHKVHTNDSGTGKMRHSNNNNNNSRMLHPFWKRPLSAGMGSENEGSIGSRRRVDIQQKLQEKKRQQFAELKEIEQEIKEGKLKRPQVNEIPSIQAVSVHQPIPAQRRTLHENLADDPPLFLHPRPPFLIPNSVDPNDQVILDPQYLMYATPHNMEGSTDCCYYDNPDWPLNFYEPEPMYQNDEVHGHSSSGGGGIQRRRRNAKNKNSKNSIYKSCRMTSDIESQISFSRSYTLPREFVFKKKMRKSIKNDQFVPSTNSSDGDVDSGEDAEIYGTLGPIPLPLPSMFHVNKDQHNVVPTKSSSAPQPSKKPIGRRRKMQHETKL